MPGVGASDSGCKIRNFLRLRNNSSRIFRSSRSILAAACGDRGRVTVRDFSALVWCDIVGVVDVFGKQKSGLPDTAVNYTTCAGNARSGTWLGKGGPPLIGRKTFCRDTKKPALWCGFDPAH